MLSQQKVARTYNCLNTKYCASVSFNCYDFSSFTLTFLPLSVKEKLKAISLLSQWSCTNGFEEFQVLQAMVSRRHCISYRYFCQIVISLDFCKRVSRLRCHLTLNLGETEKH